MLMIKGVWYQQCTFCLLWFPLEEIGWSDEFLGWTCYKHILSPHQAW